MSNRTKIVAIPKTTTTTFSPTSITGCSLWLDGADAATLTQGGGTVSQWSDKSGNARHITQATTGNQPTYSSTSNAVVFTGSQYLNIPTALAATTPVYTIFVVERRASANVMFFIGQYNLMSANTALILGYNSATVSHHTTAYVSDCQVTVPTYAGASEPMRINRYDYTGTTRATFINGGALSTTQSFSATLTTWSSANVGIGFGTIYGYIGNIHEIIFYNATLTTTQQQTIESYLAQKWGMTSSLAAGHPGLTTTVYTITAAVPKQKISSIPKVTFVNYLPTSITGCKVWFDAYDASYTTTGTTVTGWTNKTGNANASTGGGTVSINLATLGGKSSVRFSAGTNYLNVGSLSYSTAYRNQFFVVTVGASGTPYFYLNCDDGICGQCYSWSDGDIEINKSGTLGLRAYPTGFFSSTTIVSICTSSGSNTGIWVNGTNKTLTDNNTGTGGFWSTGSASPTLGGQSGRTTGTTDIYELLQYDGILTTTQRQTIESYLAQKWGLTANLVAGHPGLTTTVYGTTTAATVRQKIGYIPFIPLAQYIQAFTYTGSNQTFTVPSRTTSITLYMWGAGGGGNTNYGGAGAMVQGVLSVTPGESLTIVIGQGGTIDGTTTFGGGGAGGGNMAFGGDPGIGYSGNGSPQNAGSGGGRSAIQRGGTDPTNDIVVAGGGGGGTYFSSDRGGSATFSGTANPGIGGLPGLGGTQSAGGAGGGTGQYGQGLGGSRGIGGNTYNTNIFNGGGGGGGGYYGGGGGGTNGGDGAGGGGGSSLTSTLSLISGQSVLGFNSTNGFTAPNNTSPYYVSGVGNGAPAISSNPRAGGNGRVVLVYMA